MYYNIYCVADDTHAQSVSSALYTRIFASCPVVDKLK